MGEKELREAMISTYGNVKLDKQERMFLSLGPEFTVLDRIDQRLRPKFGGQNQTGTKTVPRDTESHFHSPKKINDCDMSK